MNELRESLARDLNPTPVSIQSYSFSNLHSLLIEMRISSFIIFKPCIYLRVVLTAVYE